MAKSEDPNDANRATGDDRSLAVEMRIRGLVQGVSFRDSTRRRAVELGVAGLVRNVEDGSVYVFAEGAKEDVELLISWCRRGPPGARVTEALVSAVPPRGLAGFRIERTGNYS